MPTVELAEEAHPACMQISRTLDMREVVESGKRVGDHTRVPRQGVQKGVDQAGIFDRRYSLQLQS